MLACHATKDQQVFVLGATHMLVLDPKQPQSRTVVNHGVLYPADLTSAGDQVFVTSFDSHLITSFSVKNPEKIIFYEPTNPTLLSAGGIQVRVQFCAFSFVYGLSSCHLRLICLAGRVELRF